MGLFNIAVSDTHLPRVTLNIEQKSIKIPEYHMVIVSK